MIAATKATPIHMDIVIVQVYFLQINATSIDEKDRIKKLCKRAHSEMLASMGLLKEEACFDPAKAGRRMEVESCYKKGIVTKYLKRRAIKEIVDESTGHGRACDSMTQ